MLIDVDKDVIPTLTWGTSPQDTVPITGLVPDPEDEKDPIRKSAIIRSLEYMGLVPRTRMVDIPIDKVLLLLLLLLFYWILFYNILL